MAYEEKTRIEIQLIKHLLKPRRGLMWDFFSEPLINNPMVLCNIYFNW